MSFKYILDFTKMGKTLKVTAVDVLGNTFCVLSIKMLYKFCACNLVWLKK